MARYKVYISSTYQDLKEHRKQVIDFFGKKTIKENFDLVSMEGYVAADIAPAMECIEDVKQCNIFILVLANRYGFIPPGDNPQALSITEMEYNTAMEDDKKTILAFFADETDARFEYDNDKDNALAALKKEKLNAFKIRVRNAKLTHPEPFVSAYQLTLQIAESLMRKSFIAYRLENARSYCCDRVPQFSRLLQVRTKGFFKSVIIYGNRKELGLNLINRFNIFSLDLPEDAIQSQLVTFEDFLISDDYIQNRNSLLAYIYDKYFHNSQPDEISLNAFLTAFKKTATPLVLVINCDGTMFEENQQQFARQFMKELHEAANTNELYDIYLFLNFEDNGQSPELEQKITLIQQSIQEQESYLCVLPRLQPLSPQLVRTWIINYITPNPGRAEELMDTCFSNLSVPLSMYEAEKKIHGFINEVNNNNAAILNIIR
jgi:Domain of unknown function (DUF4062)